MLYANTDDGSSAQWVCDGNGIVVDNIAIYGAERVPILEQINEHYGTSFTGWSDNEIYLRYGNPIPNWSAYEKIEIDAEYYQIADGEHKGIFGYVKGSVFYVFANDEQRCYIANQIGVILDTYNPTLQQAESYALPKLNAAGINVESFLADKITLSVGETVSNWSQYEIIQA